LNSTDKEWVVFAGPHDDQTGHRTAHKYSNALDWERLRQAVSDQ